MLIERNRKTSQQGFTLLELLITIAVIGLIATLMLANFKQGEKVKRVQLTIDGVVNLIRLGQNYTLAGKQIQRTSGCSGDNTIADYRIVVTNASSVINLYADDKCGTAVLIDKYTLPDKVQQKNNGVSYTVCSPSCSTVTANRVEFLFTPPFGKITARTGSSGSYTDFSSADITYQSTDGTSTKTFRVDGVSGRIGN